MGFRFKQSLVGEKRCVMTLLTAAEETTRWLEATMARSLSEKFKYCAQDNWLRFEAWQKLKARVGKPAILGCLR